MKFYFLSAYRNLLRNPLFSCINIFGLSVGIACSLLITLYLANELTYEQHFANHKNIYRLAIKYKSSKEETKYLAACEPHVAPTLSHFFSDIQVVTRILPTEGTIVGTGKKSLYSQNIFFADSSFFRVFEHFFIYGNAQETLQKPASVIVTETFAKELFQTTQVLGKKITLKSTNKFQYDGEFTITGVVKDYSNKTHFPFQALISWQPNSRFVQTSWVYTYFTSRKKNISYTILTKWSDYYKAYLARYQSNTQKDSTEVALKPIVQAISDIHLRSKLSSELYPNGNLNYLYIFLGVAIFLVLVASINYVNLTTARASQRLKEIGMRKVLGAERKDLIIQFLLESVFLTVLAFLFALSLLELTLPYFNNILEKNLQLSDLYTSGWFYMYLLVGLFLGIALLSGVYPALYLSGFLPLEAFKGGVREANYKVSFRKTLVVTQFVITLITLVGTTMVYQQLYFLVGKDLGLQKNDVLVVRLPQTELVVENLESIKNSLLQSPDIYRVGNAVEIVGGNLFSQFRFEAQTSKGIEEILMGRMEISEDFLETLNIKIVEGRGFDERQEEDFTEGCLVNEAVVVRLGWKNPIGKKIIITRDEYGNPKDFRKVVGVVKNFHFTSLHTPVQPLVMVLSNRIGNLFVNIEPKNYEDALLHIKDVWVNFLPDEPLSYFFLNENFDNHYLAEEKLGELLTYFSFLTILIACLGLLGLTLLTSELKTKEIAIRKVLGASISSLLWILSKDFLRLVLIAVVLSVPVGYFAIKLWLKNFAYRAEIQWYLFAFAAAVALLSALFPLLYQSWQKAQKSPLESLRSE